MFLKLIIEDGIKVLFADPNIAFKSGKKTKKINKGRIFWSVFMNLFIN